jgi:anti-sigma-K factor RskA
MDAETLHELTAAYALDALADDERHAYEEHLASCERCREEVAELSLAAASLAYASEPVAPPPNLRGRILDAARAERPNVVPLRPRWASPITAVAAVAACAAVGLGIWNISLHNELGASHTEALERVPVSGASGSVVVTSSGAGALLLSDLVSAPVGKTYEAWVLVGKKAERAGIFRGGQTETYVKLLQPVPRGATVAVTVEPAGGTRQPTGTPFVVSSRI